MVYGNKARMKSFDQFRPEPYTLLFSEVDRLDLYPIPFGNPILLSRFRIQLHDRFGGSFPQHPHLPSGRVKIFDFLFPTFLRKTKQRGLIQNLTAAVEIW